MKFNYITNDNEKTFIEVYEFESSGCDTKCKKKQIIEEGHEICYGCNNTFLIETLTTQNFTGSIKSVCDNCLIDGTIKRCSLCHIFIYCGEKLLYNFKHEWPDNKIYCIQCEPITFYFNMAAPFSKLIEIYIPEKNEAKLSWGFFYDEIARILQVPVDKVLIEKQNKSIGGKMFLCPCEYSQVKHRTFDASITI